MLRFFSRFVKGIIPIVFLFPGLKIFKKNGFPEQKKWVFAGQLPLHNGSWKKLQKESLKFKSSLIF
jgi:hypothetical protein